MLITLITWIYQLLIILPFGLFLITLKSQEKESKELGLPDLTLAFLLGLTVVTSITSLLSLVSNISWMVHSFVLLLAAILWMILVRQKKLRHIRFSSQYRSKFQTAVLAIFLLAVGAVLILATISPENPDTGIYHAQAIHWIETYKAVPGLANLHQRFGYNSNWLVANALFSLSFLKIQSFHLLPSTLFVVMICYFFCGIFAVAGRSKKFADLAKASFFIAAFLLLPQEISSPGTDLPVTLTTWFICSEWIRLVESPQPGDLQRGLWLSVLTIFCVTIKLSSVPLMIFTIWFLVKELRGKRWNSFLLLAIAAFFIIGPFVGRNIIISGHLFYPGIKSDPIRVDWAVTAESMLKEKEVIHWFAVLPRKPIEEFRAMTWQEQYKKWFFNQVPRHQAMLIFLCAALLITSISFAFRKGRVWLNQYEAFSPIFITMIAGVAFWLVSAPAFRFGYGFILALIVLAGIPLLLILDALFKQNRFFLPTLVNLAALGIIVLALTNFSHPKSLNSRILLPLDYPSWKTQVCEFGNFSIKCQTEYDSCWYTPFPCVLQGDKKVFMRGEDFSEGFRIHP